jgi:hypothetical protein
MSSLRARVTFAIDPAASAALQCAQSAANALANVATVRLVAVDRLIGRDLREADRFVSLGRRTFAAVPHLRELASQCRDKTLALLFDEDAQRAHQDDELSPLRRYCGRIVVDDREAMARLRHRLLAPVHVIAPDDARALWSLLTLAPGADDSVETNLQQAQQHLAREDQLGAFAAAARALQLAPDQPGIVADVARLLAGLGERQRAVALCRSFLDQRPDSTPVGLALAELSCAR